MLSKIRDYIVEALRLSGEAQCIRLDHAWGDQLGWRPPLDLRVRRRTASLSTPSPSDLQQEVRDASRT